MLAGDPLPKPPEAPDGANGEDLRLLHAGLLQLHQRRLTWKDSTEGQAATRLAQRRAQELLDAARGVLSGLDPIVAEMSDLAEAGSFLGGAPTSVTYASIAAAAMQETPVLRRGRRESNGGSLLMQTTSSFASAEGDAEDAAGFEHPLSKSDRAVAEARAREGSSRRGRTR